MSGSCCGGSTKSEPAKVALTTALKVTEVTEVTTERPAPKSNKSECSNHDKPAKSEKHGCGC